MDILSETCTLLKKSHLHRKQSAGSVIESITKVISRTTGKQHTCKYYATKTDTES